jgi:methylenetetrahydrofolate reductase (NADPH)
MRIIDCFGSTAPVFSFEFFPPKTPEGVKNLFATLSELAPLKPSFVSVTYGAGGSTRELTLDLVTRIRREVGLEAMAHLTCVGHSAGELDTLLARLRDAGVENVLALRGDPPKGAERFERVPQGFGFASELVEFIRGRYDFCLGAACYPEGHVESRDPHTDLLNLKRKADAGADFLVSQLFFDPADYFRFVERARGVGIEVPIVPGIMPVTNVTQLERFTTMCGATIPPALRERLDAVRDDEPAVIAAGIEWATAQGRALLEGGAPGIHFYTLNRSLSTRMVYQNLHAPGG